MKISASPPLNILGAAALIYALYLPIALWLQHSYVPPSHPSPPPRLAARAWPLQTISPYGHGGKAFHAHVDVFGPLEEDNEAEQHSPVVLYEDGYYSQWRRPLHPLERRGNGLLQQRQHGPDQERPALLGGVPNRSPGRQRAAMRPLSVGGRGGPNHPVPNDRVKLTASACRALAPETNRHHNSVRNNA
jgi:hypothetical protein